jgi:hypothetical protein
MEYHRQLRRRAQHHFRVPFPYLEQFLALRPLCLRCLAQVSRDSVFTGVVATGLWPVSPAPALAPSETPRKALAAAAASLLHLL